MCWGCEHEPPDTLPEIESIHRAYLACFHFRDQNGVLLLDAFERAMDVEEMAPESRKMARAVVMRVEAHFSAKRAEKFDKEQKRREAEAKSHEHRTPHPQVRRKR